MTRGWSPCFVLGAVALLGACPGPGYPRCEGDQHCQDHEVCVFAECHACALDAHCPADKQCRGYKCVPRVECTADAECPDGKVCRDGHCALQCSVDSECAARQACKDNRCLDVEPSCREHADCGVGQACHDGACVTPQPGDADYGAVYRAPAAPEPPPAGPVSAVDPTGGRLLCGEEVRLYFGFNESQLVDDSRATLRRTASCLKETKAAEVTIQGHTDERGSTEYNLALGERRGLAVRMFLRDLGISDNRLHVVSVGEERPLEPGHDEAAWARNRRAEIYPR